MEKLSRWSLAFENGIWFLEALRAEQTLVLVCCNIGIADSLNHSFTFYCYVCALKNETKTTEQKKTFLLYFSRARHAHFQKRHVDVEAAQSTNCRDYGSCFFFLHALKNCAEILFCRKTNSPRTQKRKIDGRKKPRQRQIGVWACKNIRRRGLVEAQKALAVKHAIIVALFSPPYTCRHVTFKRSVGHDSIKQICKTAGSNPAGFGF